MGNTTPTVGYYPWNGQMREIDAQIYHANPSKKIL